MRDGSCRQGKESAGSRISVANLDLNNLAWLLALGLIAIVGLRLAGPRSLLIGGLLAWLPALVVLLVQLRGTGSRGATLCLGVGMLCLFFKYGRLLTKLHVQLVLALLAALFVGVLIKSETMRNRWEMILSGDKEDPRMAINRASWQTFLDRPLVGWGPAAAPGRTAEPRCLRAAYAQPRKDRYPQRLVLVLDRHGTVGNRPHVAGALCCARGLAVAEIDLRHLAADAAFHDACHGPDGDRAPPQTHLVLFRLCGRRRRVCGRCDLETPSHGEPCRRSPLKCPPEH